MKKILNIATVVMVTSLIIISPVQAKTFKTTVKVEADNNGIVTIEGGDDIVTLIQYCPDNWKDECDVNIPITRTGNSFVLDKDGLAKHQTAFNFRNTSGQWLLIPNQYVGIDKEIKIEQGSNGAYFIYTGIIPQQ
jgi:hypothetical protein